VGLLFEIPPTYKDSWNWMNGMTDNSWLDDANFNGMGLVSLHPTWPNDITMLSWWHHHAMWNYLRVPHVTQIQSFSHPKRPIKLTTRHVVSVTNQCYHHVMIPCKQKYIWYSMWPDLAYLASTTSTQTWVPPRPLSFMQFITFTIMWNFLGSIRTLYDKNSTSWHPMSLHRDAKEATTQSGCNIIKKFMSYDEKTLRPMVSITMSLQWNFHITMGRDTNLRDNPKLVSNPPLYLGIKCLNLD